jgi:hypothetical protein
MSKYRSYDFRKAPACQSNPFDNSCHGMKTPSQILSND